MDDTRRAGKPVSATDRVVAAVAGQPFSNSRTFLAVVSPPKGDNLTAKAAMLPVQAGEKSGIVEGMARQTTMLPPKMSTVPDGSDDRATTTYTATMPSPIGDLVLIAGPKGLRAVLWPGEEELCAGAVDASDLLSGTGGHTAIGAEQDSRPDAVRVLADAIRQLGEYFDGDRQEFDLPLDPIGTDFQLAVWMVLRDIPYGQTITYGEQADELGDVNKARAVGSANGRNPISIIVPCHRVVGADGSLTGYGGGIDIKDWLLAHERSRTSPQLPFD